MARKALFPAFQANDGWSIIPSDTEDVKLDNNNTQEYEHCFLHNPSTTTTVTVRVMPAASVSGATPITIAVPAGTVFPLAVRRVYATDPVTAEGDFIGLVGLTK